MLVLALKVSVAVLLFASALVTIPYIRWRKRIHAPAKADEAGKVE
jgi:hypothetical protein